jgi:hypothetical protein
VHRDAVDLITREAEMYRAMEAAEAGRAGALEEVIAACNACNTAAASQFAAEAEEELRDCRNLLHIRETPNPRMTAALHSSGPVQSVSALLDHHGHLVDDDSEDCKEVLVPILAAVFTAIGTAVRAPARFTDGIISPIYKAGQRADAANYRPITLLNADYRLLAKKSAG